MVFSVYFYNWHFLIGEPAVHRSRLCRLFTALSGACIAECMSTGFLAGCSQLLFRHFLRKVMQLLSASLSASPNVLFQGNVPQPGNLPGYFESHRLLLHPACLCTWKGDGSGRLAERRRRVLFESWL